MSRHIYTVAEIARSEPERLAKTLELAPDAAQKLKAESVTMLETLRKRSECRKFMRNHLIPKRGRSSARIMSALKEAGVTDLAGLARANLSLLQKAGIGEKEADDILSEARITYSGQILKETGIPAVSLKKYLAAGVGDPDAFWYDIIGSIKRKNGHEFFHDPAPRRHGLPVPQQACAKKIFKTAAGERQKTAAGDQGFV